MAKDPDDDAIVITGVGIVSPLAGSMDDLSRVLATGRIAAGQRAVGFEERAALPHRQARRLSRLALMTLAATRSALADARLAHAGERTAVVLGTGFGSLGTTVGFMRSYLGRPVGEVEPSPFPQSVLNEPAAQVAIALALRGPNVTVTQFGASPFAALAAGADLLRLGRADAVVCGAADELGPEIAHGLARLGLLSRSGCARPFDRRRDGIVPGEAVCMLILERARDATARNRRVYARVGGVALGADPRRAIAQALGEGGVEPDAVDYVALAGNGSPRHDADEAVLLASVFGSRAVCAGSILGAAGECASSAALRFAQALLALDQRFLAGTPGFEEPDPAALVPGLLREGRARSAKAVLVATGATARSAGGAAAAVFTR